MKQKEIDDLKRMYKHYNNKCFACGKKATNRAHIIGQGKMSRKKWGNLVIDNILDWLPSCDECNDLIDVGQNINASKVATIILSRESFNVKKEAIEHVVRENIKRKRGKNGR